MTRPSGRSASQLRPVKITRGYARHAEGSALIAFGDTHVLCTATVEAGVPRFMRGEGRGWITAEYGMLPRSTHSRMGREASRGKQGGRTLEIQRLIGRSLRSAVNLEQLGEYTITLDCDVLQADGGTRTAAITGSCVALCDAFAAMRVNGQLQCSPLRSMVAAISVGVVAGEVVSDLDYLEDSSAETDMNVVMDAEGGLIEVQGTAEGQTFSRSQLDEMLDKAEQSIAELVGLQKTALE